MNYRARGLSLIEVVVGMAILGTFLTTIFLAQARLTKQSVIARKKAHAITAVNELLATWALDWESIPTDDTGTLPTSGGQGGDSLQWTTRLIDTPELTALGLQKVQLTLVDTAIANSTEPLLQMELAVMLPPDPEVKVEAGELTPQLPVVTEDQTPQVMP